MLYMPPQLWWPFGCPQVGNTETGISFPAEVESNTQKEIFQSTAEIEQPTGFAVSPQSQAEQTNTLWSIADGVGPQSLAAVFQMVMLPERAGCMGAVSIPA